MPRPELTPDKDRFKEGDLVTWTETGDSSVWRVMKKYGSRDYYYIQIVDSSFAHRYSLQQTLVSGDQLCPFTLPSNGPLYFFKLIPARKNWRFTGCESIIVVTDSPASAMKIGPDGIVKTWPVEGWADDIAYIQAWKLGTAEPFLKENTIISTSYHNE